MSNTRSNVGESSAANVLGASANEASNLSQNLEKVSQNTESLRQIASEAERTKESFRELSGATRRVNENLREMGPSSQRAMRQMGEGAEDVSRKVRRLSDEMREGFGDKLSQVFQRVLAGVQRITNEAKRLNEMFVALNKNATQMFGAGGVGDLHSRLFGQQFKDLQSSVFEIAATSKHSVDEIRQSFETLARSSIDTARSMDAFGQNRSTMDLVNQGILDLNDVIAMTSESLVMLGSNQDQTERMFQGIGASVTRATEDFGKMIISTHQLGREVLTLQQSFRFMGADVERMPQQIMAFAEAAERFRATTDRGMTGAVAAQLGTRLMSNIAGMTPENRMFFGQMAGLGTGVSAGEEMRLMLQGEGGAGRATETLLRVMQQQGMGGEFLTSQQYIEARDRGDVVGAERIAQQRLMQSQLLQTFTGVSEQEALGLLDSLGGGNFEDFAETLRESSMSERQLLAKQTEILEDQRDLVRTFMKSAADQHKEMQQQFEMSLFGSENAQKNLRDAARAGEIINYLQTIVGLLGLSGLTSVGRGAFNIGRRVLSRRTSQTMGRVATRRAAQEAARQTARQASREVTRRVAEQTGRRAAQRTLGQTVRTGSRFGRMRGALNRGLADPVSRIGGQGLGGQALRLGTRAFGGATSAYLLGQRAYGLATHGERQYSAESTGGRMLEGALDDFSTIAGAFAAGGPITGLVAALTVLGTNVTEAVVQTNDLRRIRRETAETSRAGTARLTESIAGRHGRGDFREWLVGSQDAFTSIGQRNQGNILLPWHNQAQTAERVYSRASRSEQAVLEETFNRLVDALEHGRAQEARDIGRLLGDITPAWEGIDASVQALGRHLDRANEIQAFDYHRLQLEVEEQREEAREERQERAREERKEQERAREEREEQEREEEVDSVLTKIGKALEEDELKQAMISTAFLTKDLTKDIDETTEGLKEVLKDQSFLQISTFDAMSKTLAQQREKELQESETRRQNEEKEEQRIQKMAERPIVVNLAAAPITLDGDIVARAVGQRLVLDGKVQSGPNPSRTR